MVSSVSEVHLSDYSVLVSIPGTSLTLAMNTSKSTSVVLSDETVKQLSQGHFAAIPNSMIATLTHHAILTNETSSQERNTFWGVLASRGKEVLSAPRRVYLMPSYDCNLKCTYCFQHKIRRSVSSECMSERTARAAFSYLDGVFQKGIPRGLTLYGGEALTPANRSIVEFICAEARQHEFSLMAATHGWNLDHYEDLLGPHKISALHITVDGPASIHDTLRVGPGRCPTFETIMTHIEMALARNTRVRMRVNVDSRVLARLEEFRDHLEAKGILRNSLFSAYLAPMFATKAQLDFRSAATTALVNESMLAKKLAEHPDLARAFGGYPPIFDRISAVVAGREPDAGAGHCCYGAPTIVLDPKGDIYPCVFLAGERNYAVGTYLPSDHRCPAGVENWVEEGTRRCRVKECKYAPYCGAGSPYDSFARFGSSTLPSCDCFDFAQTFAGYAIAAYWRLLR